MAKNNNRSYNCFYKQRTSQGNLIKVSNNACWLGVNSQEFKNNRNSLKGTKFEEDINTIYIYEFKESHISDKDRKRLLFLINLITPCKIVTIDGEKYIKFTLIRDCEYKPNLTLLNLLRQSWYNDYSLRQVFNIEQFYNDIHQKRKRNEDVLSFLLTHMKNNTIDVPNNYMYGGHSIILKNLKIKTTHQLLNDVIVDCNQWLQL